MHFDKSNVFLFVFVPTFIIEIRSRINSFISNPSSFPSFPQFSQNKGQIVSISDPPNQLSQFSES